MKIANSKILSRASLQWNLSRFFCQRDARSNTCKVKRFRVANNFVQLHNYMFRAYSIIQAKSISRRRDFHCEFSRLRSRRDRDKGSVRKMAYKGGQVAALNGKQATRVKFISRRLARTYIARGGNMSLPCVRFPWQLSIRVENPDRVTRTRSPVIRPAS